MEFCWYAFFAIAFNIGWACIQISHMSLIPQLSVHKNRKNILIGLRTAWTYISNFLVLLLAFGLFTWVDTPKYQFMILSFSVLALGILLNVIFIFGINEKKLSAITDKAIAQRNKPVRKVSVAEQVLTDQNRRVLRPLSPKRKESNQEPLLPTSAAEDKISAG